MTIHWFLVAGFLYFEVGLIILLILPFISPQRWLKIFRSRSISLFSSRGGVYFNAILVALGFSFLGALYEVRQFSKETSTPINNVNADNRAHMRLFRAQRNIYISGFALFLVLVLRRLITLISQHATLISVQEATLKQAKSATEAAQKLLDQETEMKKKNEVSEEDTEELKRLTEKVVEKEEIIITLTDDCNRYQRDFENLKNQAAQNNKAYDGLMEEHARLQKLVAELQGNSETKKEE